MLIHTKGCSSSDWKSKPSIPWAVDRFQVALNVTDRQADLVEMVYMRHFFKAAAGKSKEPVGRDSRHKHNRWENEQICTWGNNFFTEESDLSIRNNKNCKRCMWCTRSFKFYQRSAFAVSFKISLPFWLLPFSPRAHQTSRFIWSRITASWSP